MPSSLLRLAGRGRWSLGELVGADARETTAIAARQGAERHGESLRHVNLLTTREVAS